MSDSQTYEEVTVASDGVTVTKRYEADEFPVPAIAFNFASERGEPVTVHLSDEVPEGVSVEDLGFHPEYGSEYWTIDDDQISFEREIEPGSEYTTVYGIRATGTDDVEQFLTEPELDRVDPPMVDDEGELVGEGSDAVKGVISGDADSVPGLDDVDDEEIETLDLKDPNSEGEAAPENGDDPAAATSGEDGDEHEEDGDEHEEDEAETVEEAEDTDESTATAPAVDGSVVEAMAEEIRNQNVNKEDVQLLRKAFDLASENDGSVVARVNKLQRDVDDVVAYTDALEEFLDENGTGEQLIEEFETEIEQFRESVERFENDLESVQSSVQRNEAALDDVSADVSDVESEIEAVGETVDDVESEVDGVEGQVADLEERLADIESELETVREDVSTADVEDKLDEIDGEIEELKAWREQLSSVIGGGD